jgi:probable O-glycosylation ligase (exosortase A-associated)
MRTVLLSLVFVALVPLAIVKPWIGIMTWTWVSMMNPHRLTWGFLQSFPVAAVVGGATLIGLVLTRDRRMPPINAVTLTLLAFVLWMCFTALFAAHPSEIGTMFSKVMKIQLMIFVTMALIYKREHIEIFVWVIVVSLGFYGIKGGIYTLLHGGSGRVLGPPGGFVAGNNELALALTMIIPLMYYLRTRAEQAWLRHGLLGAMLLSALAILGSQSRGALLAIVAMAFYLWRHSQRKLVSGMVLATIAAAMLSFMPLAWESRMQTITNYERDTSAMGRINAWQMAYNLAKDRITGASFDTAEKDLFARYAPDPTKVRAAHSIYFQVLGEHGFIGLGLFLLVWFFTWRTATWVNRNARRIPGMESASRLAAMAQVTLVGYFVGGAFLSLAYFDLPYDLLAVVVLLRSLVEARLKEQRTATAPVLVAPATVAHTAHRTG